MPRSGAHPCPPPLLLGPVLVVCVPFFPGHLTVVTARPPSSTHAGRVWVALTPPSPDVTLTYSYTLGPTGTRSDPSVGPLPYTNPFLIDAAATNGALAGTQIVAVVTVATSRAGVPLGDPAVVATYTLMPAGGSEGGGGAGWWGGARRLTWGAVAC